jgi:hypothetical protein
VRRDPETGKEHKVGSEGFKQLGKKEAAPEAAKKRKQSLEEAKKQAGAAKKRAQMSEEERRRAGASKTHRPIHEYIPEKKKRGRPKKSEEPKKKEPSKTEQATATVKTTPKVPGPGDPGYRPYKWSESAGKRVPGDPTPEKKSKTEKQRGKKVTGKRQLSQAETEEMTRRHQEKGKKVTGPAAGMPEKPRLKLEHSEAVEATTKRKPASAKTKTPAATETLKKVAKKPRGKAKPKAKPAKARPVEDKPKAKTPEAKEILDTKAKKFKRTTVGEERIVGQRESARLMAAGPKGAAKVLEEKPSRKIGGPEETQSRTVQALGMAAMKPKKEAPKEVAKPKQPQAAKPKQPAEEVKKTPRSKSKKEDVSVAFTVPTPKSAKPKQPAPHPEPSAPVSAGPKLQEKTSPRVWSPYKQQTATAPQAQAPARASAAATGGPQMTAPRPTMITMPRTSTSTGGPQMGPGSMQRSLDLITDMTKAGYAMSGTSTPAAATPKPAGTKVWTPGGTKTKTPGGKIESPAPAAPVLKPAAAGVQTGTGGAQLSPGAGTRGAKLDVTGGAGGGKEKPGLPQEAKKKTEKIPQVGSAYGSLVGLGQAMGYETGGQQATTALPTGAPGQVGYRVDVAGVTPQAPVKQTSPSRTIGTRTFGQGRSSPKGSQSSMQAKSINAHPLVRGPGALRPPR